MTTWEDNADEFRDLSQGKGWPFALLVACSVEKGVGHGVGEGQKKLPEPRVSGKVSVYKFAARAECSDFKVAQYLDAWNRAAADGLVPPSRDLVPDDRYSVDLPDPRQWSDRKTKTGYFYDIGKEQKGFAPSEIVDLIEKRPEMIERIISKVTPETARRIAASPAVQVAAAQLPTPATEYTKRKNDERRNDVDQGDDEMPAVSALQHIIDAETVDRAIDRMVDSLKNGLLDRVGADVKTEAAQQFRRWIVALEWATTIAEGGSVTDDSIAAWLAG